MNVDYFQLVPTPPLLELFMKESNKMKMIVNSALIYWNTTVLASQIKKELILKHKLYMKLDLIHILISFHQDYKLGKQYLFQVFLTLMKMNCRLSKQKRSIFWTISIIILRKLDQQASTPNHRFHVLTNLRVIRILLNHPPKSNKILVIIIMINYKTLLLKTKKIWWLRLHLPLLP